MSALPPITSFISKTLATSLLAGTLIAGTLIASCVASDVDAAEQTISGRVASVTVYRDQARVIREIKIPASDQPQQIRVTGLPPQLIQRSSFTESDEGTNVRSLQVTLPDAKERGCGWRAKRGVEKTACRGESGRA